MHVLPKSTFGRIALLIGGLLLINQIIVYVSYSVYFTEPFMKQIMHLVAMQVRVHYIDHEGKLTIDPLLRATYRDVTQIETFDGKTAWAKGLSEAVHYQSFTDELNRALGHDLKSEVRIQEGDFLYMWLRSPYNPDDWLRIPLPQFAHGYPSPLFIYLTAITLLSILGGWLFTQQMARPLRRLEFAARELGRGDAPGVLKETGTRELVAVTRAFNQMARDLHRLEQDRTMLLAGISHDLRTPLTRIRLASEFMPEDSADLRDGIVRDTEDMDEIIDQFISFVRDGRDERSVPGDFNTLVRQAAEPASLNEGDLIFDLADLPPVPFKALAMKRLARNLVENAFRYAGPPVTVRTRVDGNNVVLSVLDEGPGVNEADIQRLFQPFTRGDSARGGRGTGLGLAIVKRIAEMHRATIVIQNRPEGGLEARLELPYC